MRLPLEKTGGCYLTTPRGSATGISSKLVVTVLSARGLRAAVPLKQEYSIAVPGSRTAVPLPKHQWRGRDARAQRLALLTLKKKLETPPNILLGQAKGRNPPPL